MSPTAVVSVSVLLVAVMGYFLLRHRRRDHNTVLPHSPYLISLAAREKHSRLNIVDWHCDALMWDRDLLVRSDRGHVDIPRLIEGNVAIQVFAAVTKTPENQTYGRQNRGDSDSIRHLAVRQKWPNKTWDSLLERALYQSFRLHQYAAEAPGRLRIIGARGELEDALQNRDRSREKGKTGPVLAILDIEGAHCLEGRIENLAALYDAGYRMIGPLHFFDNELGGSLHGIDGGGLTEFGRAVIQRADEMGFIIDLAHASPKVVDDILTLSNRSPVISHTGVHGVCSSERNVSDEHVKRIADKGGLIAIGYWDAAVGDISPAGIVKSIRYAIDLVGEDHVSLGSDFDGSTTTALDTSELAVLTQAMMDARFTDTQISKVMGDNAVAFLLAHLPQS